MAQAVNRRDALKTGGAVVVGLSGAGCLGLIRGDSKSEVVVSSKSFPEQFILSYLSLVMLEQHGYKTVDKTGLGGSLVNFRALKEGESDHYWEYTGTGWSNILGHEKKIRDPEKLYDKVDAEYNKKFNIDWLQRAPFNNTYVIMANPEWVKKTGVKTLEELGQYVSAGHTDFSIAMNSEMKKREDAWGGLPAAYGFAEKKAKINVEIMKIGLAYKAVAQGQVQLGFGFATNPKVRKFGLKILDDTKNFFIIYNPAPNVRNEKFDQSMKDLLNQIPRLLDTETQRSLNAKVIIEGKEARSVAKNFLQQHGLI
jgi:osmoprotectant transport system substrate-binding protein